MIFIYFFPVNCIVPLSQCYCCTETAEDIWKWGANHGERDFGLRDTFQERIAPKSIIEIDKLRKKFSALNVDFYGPSLDFLGSRKPAHEGIKKWYTRKSYFTVVGQSFVKTVANRHGHAAYHNKHYCRAFQSYRHRWLWKTLNFRNEVFIDLCDLWLQRTLQE